MPLTPPSYSPNPYVAYVWLKVGGEEVTVYADGRPKSLLSFTYNIIRKDAGANNAKIEVFDPTWVEIESLLIKNDINPVEFRYGYTTGLMSPTYKGIVMGYEPTFVIDGVKISIEILSQGILTTPKTYRQGSKHWEGMLISEVVQDIANENGWGLVVDETKPVWDNHGLEEAKLDHAHWTKNKMTDLQFIKEVLRPRAIRASDEVGDYRAYFDDDTNTLHFHPPRVEEGPFKTYTWRKDKMTEVISFTPKIAGLLRMRQGGGVTAAPNIDVQEGKYSNAENNDSTTATKTLLGGDQTIVEEFIEETYHVSTLVPVRDEDQAQMVAKNAYYQGFNGIQGATLKIHGDPTIPGLGTVLKVIVILPTGEKHYTSGNYAVRKITDSIANGAFTTTIDLFRHAFEETGSASAKTGTGKVNA